MQQRKILTWRLFYLGLCCSLITGIYACNNQVNSGINLEKFKIGANVTPIQKISQKNQDTTIYIQGTVEKTAPLIKKKAYQINDSTGKIWIITNQGNFRVGENVVLKGNVQYKKISLAGKEYGGIYLEVK
ncbi:hypothetical protein PN480_02805 [Dolichospermum circinale CS-1225]|uniref:Uncharacterized protein n=1 Tax=Dolichospermum circinale CS-537/01 TaxID=3021739 RepID=A0ABT5A6K5_9CYAN|nr:hypothetical protein [Dolichospermum circinale]MDB9459794.1 hypothetical protein [Dolichospermum circinale CS-545/17]MDB9466524.1 hypothetical protein [Dolichospermum circinale CS-539/09]MDB9472071.1 hypothetical protein [Dolichospermum circinale CS-539]MDB9487584.1 hypothetical protein [Dolichospermum circinale CS-537/01]MDB9520883.1 hypothetical protein [Dolichospermum circinale CS-1225]